MRRRVARRKVARVTEGGAMKGVRSALVEWVWSECCSLLGKEWRRYGARVVLWRDGHGRGLRRLVAIDIGIRCLGRDA